MSASDRTARRAGTPPNKSNEAHIFTNLYNSVIYFRIELPYGAGTRSRPSQTGDRAPSVERVGAPSLRPRPLIVSLVAMAEA